jgi:hypothetical protein
MLGENPKGTGPTGRGARELIEHGVQDKETRVDALLLSFKTIGRRLVLLSFPFLSLFSPFFSFYLFVSFYSNF